MKCKWILEEDVFEEGLGRLTAALEANGNPYKFVKYFQVVEDLENNKSLDFSEDDSPVTFYGSLNLAKYLQHKTHFLPGPICNLKNFRYTYYAPNYGNLLVNNDWVCLPLREAIRQKDLLFRVFSHGYFPNAYIFTRPVYGDKPFAGKVLKYDEFNLDGFYYGMYFEDKDLPIVISSTKPIGREFRYFIGDKKTLSFSQVGLKKRSFPQMNDLSGEKFVGEVIRKVDFQPDDCYTLDIGETENGWRVIEINSASCSGMYDCDPLPIIQCMSSIAEREWREVYNI